MKKLSLTIACLFSLTVFSQNNYAVSTIPEALKKDAHVVKRMEDIRFEVLSLDNTRFIRRYALTILDPEGQHHADFAVQYDKMHHINSIEGTLYDAAGNQLKKVKGKVIRDMSAVSEVSLFDDNRMKVHDFDHHSYPYTVEYEVDMSYDNSYSFPTWMPQGAENLSVEKSSYTMVYPENYSVRNKVLNCSSKPTIVTEKGKKGELWQVSNLPAISRPYASPGWQELTPVVFFAPTEFAMQGYKGNASSWQSFGDFALQLNRNRDKLSPEMVQKVASLIQSITDPKEKVRKLYEYMQGRTRYISIQLGIGGLQPFEAMEVERKGYGDCKALSNYMYSLLKSAGIPSYYTLVRGGRSLDDRFIMPDFSYDVFNHIILAVPMAKDTMWLECTSQTDPAGYMGDFTGSRNALLITDAGGKLVSTPHYGLNENYQLRHIKAKVDAEGTLTAETVTRYGATQQDYYFGLMNNLSKERVRKLLNERLDFSTYDINDFSYAAKKAELPEVTEKLSLSVSNYATVSGRRLFILPNLMTRNSKRNLNATERKVDYVFGQAYRDVDTVEISIPAGYELEAVPAATSLKTPFGTYASSVKVEGDKMVYHRSIEHYEGRYKPADGIALQAFFDAIYRADRSKVVLVKKAGGEAKPVL